MSYENYFIHLLITDDVPNLTPEKYASFISRIVFGWFDAMNIAGWKRLLTYADLWSLRKENRCSGVVPNWDKYWDKHTGYLTFLPKIFQPHPSSTEFSLPNNR